MQTSSLLEQNIGPNDERGDALSLTGRQWTLSDADERLAQTIMQQHNLPDALARILAVRGVAVEAVESFLNPSLKATLPDPSHLLDMDKAVERLVAAIAANEKIVIWGDYDVDGATSSALLIRYLRAVGANPGYYIPDRMSEGYGPNAPALLKLKEEGAALVITVDCGTLAFEPLEAAASVGLDVIVIDHHQGEARRPKAVAIVNPNRLDETSPHKHLAAVGMAFLLCVALNRKLREMGYFSSPRRGEVGRGAEGTLTYPFERIRENARELRKTMTDAENLMWYFLRKEQFGVKFRKQHPIGNYITDFACLNPKLVIELDGGQHNELAAIKKDAERTQFLEQQGYKVLRFWNNDVLQNTEGVLETIYNFLHSVSCPPPNLPPLGGGIPEPDLRQWLDIVAVGTVCDVVPLLGANRAFVAQGLKKMADRNNTGLRTVLDLAAVESKPSVYHAGFVIGPRINAGGRVGKSDLGVRLLTTDDPAEALSLAKELETHNAERKAIEKMVLEEAMALAEASADAPMLVLSGLGWHPGVLGIVAGRVKERFHKPTAVIGVENGIGKASARSVEGFDFGAAVIAAREAGLLLAGGGHAMAAGFTVEEHKIAALVEFLQARAQGIPRGQKRLRLDASVSISGATVEFVEMLERLGPFGQANPSVRLMIPNVINLKPEWTKGEEHARTLFICPVSNARLSGIAFRVAGTNLGEALFATRGKKVSVAGQLSINEWMGKRSVNLQIEDVAC